ncbi:MAG: TonB-dependent receptor, partial [Bacillota bacterium]|nr:TonB-dependent receptor [Bacillota bacterium]
LGQRSAGTVVLPSAGQVGTGAPIRIRGTRSMFLSNEPLLYIDGVRVDSDPNLGPSQRGGRWMSRMNDLNPDEILSIEIIKGPSAATLYGTEASNGVIQIITKKGVVGETRFDMSMRTGLNWYDNPAERAGKRYWINPASGQIEGVNVYEHEEQFGTGPIFTTGQAGGLSVNLGGGTDALRYFASVSYDDETGVVHWNWDKRFDTRANLDIVLSEKLLMQVRSGYVRRKTSLAQTGTGFYSDPFSNLIWANPTTLNQPRRGFFVAPPEEWSKVETRSDVDRITTGMTLNYTPAAWFTHRVTVGLDLSDSRDWSLWPRQPGGTSHFWASYGLGRKEYAEVGRRFYTADYGGSATYGLFSPDLSFTTSVGLQYYRREFNILSAIGENFAAPPLTTISGGATTSSAEAVEANATLGFFVQQQVDWRNRVFVTGAVRFDDNSAFGKEFDAAVYPKLSATWVVNEEPFWNVDWVSQLRIRTAWGAAGQQPGAFDAPRLYTPGVGYGDQPALLPGSYGNPQLKPERSEELEYGLDAGLFDGRVGVEFTRHSRNIGDAIVQAPLAPSTGFPGGQVVNLGEVKAWGNELSVNVGLLDRPRLSWDLGIQYATMESRIETLGGLTQIAVGGRNEHRPGYSVGALFGVRVVSATIDSQGLVTEALCDQGTGSTGADPGGALIPCSRAKRLHIGPATPTWQIGATNTFTLFRNLRLAVRVEGNGGHHQINTELRAIHNLGNSEVILRKNDPMVQATRIYDNDLMGLYKGGFLRLKEVSATYDLPRAWAQGLGAYSGSVSLSARNLMMLWTAEHGWSTPRDGRVTPPIGGVWVWDPEVRSSGQVSTNLQTVMPAFSSAALTIRMSF